MVLRASVRIWQRVFLLSGLVEGKAVSEPSVLDSSGASSGGLRREYGKSTNLGASFRQLHLELVEVSGTRDGRVALGLSCLSRWVAVGRSRCLGLGGAASCRLPPSRARPPDPTGAWTSPARDSFPARPGHQTTMILLHSTIVEQGMGMQLKVSGSRA